MMPSNKPLRQAFSALDLSKKDKDYLIPAVLGFMINGIKTVEVNNRPGYVYARIRSNTNEVIQVFNDKVSPVYDLPVLLMRDPNDPTHYRVDSRDVGRYQNWGSTSSYLPRHGNQHSFNPDQGGGGDIVWVYGRQFMPLSLSPSGTSGAPNVLISGYTYYQNSVWKYAGGTGTSSLLGYKPTGSSARMVLIYLDDYGNPQLSAGSFFASTITGTSDILPYVPTLGATSVLPLGAVRLVSGTSVILWDNIYDLRPMLVGDGFIPTGTFGHIIQDDGVSQTARSKLNFVGSGFAVYDDAGNDATIVSGTASAASGTGTSSVDIGCRVTVNTDGYTTFEDLVSYAVPFTHTEYDTDTMHPDNTGSTNKRISINTSGKYQVNFGVDWYLDNVGAAYGSVIVSGTVNRAIAFDSVVMDFWSGTYANTTAATEAYLTAGDYVFLVLLHSTTVHTTSYERRSYSSPYLTLRKVA